MSVSEKFEHEVDEGCGLLQLRHMAGGLDRQRARIGQQLGIGFEIGLRHDTIALTAKQKRRSGDAMQTAVEIMLNEHHQTATCVDPAAPLMLAALARLSRKARLLILGNPIANRRQPVRVAEEMAMIDVLSRGRSEAGFVRGVPYEIFAYSLERKGTAFRAP